MVQESPGIDRRAILRAAVAGGGGLAFAGTLWQGAALAAPAQNGPGPYGALRAADANGIRLPNGFTSRVVARSGRIVPGTGFVWHGAPDGGACFPDGQGWIYVSNAELPGGNGGVGALRFDANGDVTGAYAILTGTSRNCAGGPTPWHTWLSCEEVEHGYVFETDPYGVAPPARRDAMGRFTHEAAACDPDRQVVYLTEDERDGCFYRFVPHAWGNLSQGGTLQVLVAGGGTSGSATWQTVPNPTPSPGQTPTRSQVGGAKRFVGGEGAYYADGHCWFTTKGDNRVWRFNAADDTYELAYDDDLVNNGPAPLTNVDNITGSALSGDLFIAEDGADMEINLITPDEVVTPFLRIEGHGSSEITGPWFTPAGDRFYFSSQRGTSGSSSGGITYEVTGPFRTRGGGPGDTTPPTVPSALTADGITETTVTLAWTASTDDTGVHRYAADLDGTVVNPAVTGTGHTYTGLSAGTTYVLGVTAYDAAGNASPRATATVTTAGDPPGGGEFGNHTDVPIRDRSTATSTIAVRGVGAAASFEVDLVILHTWVGDLTIDVIAPGGREWRLWNRSGGSADGIRQTFTLNGAGVAADGTWTLRIHDHANRDQGHLDSWTLRF